MILAKQPNFMFLEYLEKCTSKVHIKLDKLLPLEHENIISKAMRYGVLNGGKGLRSLLVMESSAIMGAPETQALQAATAIECIHSYSLVHDDLPSMDNDDLRRGKLTVHKKWNEATAILVGDGLQAIAFEILSKKATHPNPAIRLDLIESLARACGVKGMVGGQAMDIEAEKSRKTLTVDDIIKLQNLKTGALIVWAAEVGARLTGNNIKPFTNYATAVGLAFQIQDDILDVTGEIEKTGKALRKDAVAGKATFVSLLGIDAAKLKAEELVSQACDEVSLFGDKAIMLRNLARFTIERSF